MSSQTPPPGPQGPDSPFNPEPPHNPEQPYNPEPQGQPEAQQPDQPGQPYAQQPGQPYAGQQPPLGESQQGATTYAGNIPEDHAEKKKKPMQIIGSIALSAVLIIGFIVVRNMFFTSQLPSSGDCVTLTVKSNGKADHKKVSCDAKPEKDVVYQVFNKDFNGEKCAEFESSYTLTDEKSGKVVRDVCLSPKLLADQCYISKENVLQKVDCSTPKAIKVTGFTKQGGSCSKGQPIPLPDREGKVVCIEQ